MNLLVTGASGLVGGRLIKALTRDGRARVRAASRTNRSWPDGVEGVVTNALEPSTLLAACDGMDAIINLASMPEAACAADPDGALHANVGGTLALVRAAMAAGVARFVQLSTSKVYGNNPSGLITEATVTHPTSHYSITHRAAEDYALLHPTAVVLRLANGFGAPVDCTTPCWQIIVNDFCRQAVTARQIIIRSDGAAWRNFIPLDDIVGALLSAAEMLPQGTFNLGAPESMTIRSMAERVASVCEAELGYRVEVTVGASVSGTKAEPLTYSTRRIRDAGVVLNGKLDVEMARTLRCASAVDEALPDV